MRSDIKLIEPLGFCYGVRRAVNLAEQAIKDKANTRIYSLGGIIHNRDAVNKLSQKGLKVKDNLNGVKEGNAVIISSHGTEPSVLEEAKKRGIRIIDATCPNVITSQRLCERLKSEGYFIVIIGEKEHREVKALRGFAGEKNIVIKDAVEARHAKLDSKKIGVVAQTTQSKDNLTKIIKELLNKDYIELRIFNTICNDTARRQKAALDLTKKVDMMFVIGGKHSANTRRLFELCRKSGRKCLHIENDAELKREAIKNARVIGVISGASTPDWVIDNVLKRIKSFKKIYKKGVAN